MKEKRKNNNKNKKQNRQIKTEKRKPEQDL